MKTIFVVETAEELIAMRPGQAVPAGAADKDVFLPQGVELVFDGPSCVRLQKADGFELSEEIEAADVISVMAKKLGFTAFHT